MALIEGPATVSYSAIVGVTGYSVWPLVTALVPNKQNCHKPFLKVNCFEQ